MSKPLNNLRPVHPGEVLREDFLQPLGLSVNALAVALRVPATRIHEIVKERRAVQPIPRCAWRSILAAMQHHGWFCKPTTT